MPNASQRDAALADLAEAIMSVSRRLHAAGHSHPEVIQLSSLERMVMRYIDHHPGTTPGKVAIHVGLKSSNASTALRSLSDQGFVRRETDPSDGRGTLLYATEVAQQNLAHVRVAWAELLRPYCPNDDSLQAALQLLEDLDQALDCSSPVTPRVASQESALRART
ncbi:MAG: MarR family winged helix-turn-helix transcriptional regulator [Propionibacteriaceae bacterium]|jgi:DNA-binding MarR family transcriptional regulator|nr:MarR family winged helix-turn-helix transcriptional regulator [Propionibacteriaceae bacterium]